jgi:hypothetical protein
MIERKHNRDYALEHEEHRQDQRQGERSVEGPQKENDAR